MNVYLVEKGRNLIYSYYPQAMSAMRFDPTKNNFIWAVTTDLKVAIIKPEDFKNAVNGKREAEIPLEVINRNFTTSEEVKAYLEI